MRLWTFVLVVALALSSLVNAQFNPRNGVRALTPRDSPQNSGTTDVQWDSQSFIVKGQRIYGFSAEFHFWRLPVPDLWRDVLQKLKAAGFNTVSCYVHWGATNPSEGRVEWEGYRNFELFLQVAQQVGLWVIARHGPYINGETSAGGVPGRVTNIAGFLRSNDSDYSAAYQDYYRSATDIIRRYQITEGGPIILVQVENEYTNNTNFATDNPVTKNEYMQALEDILNELGIVLPLISNDSYMGQNFAPGIGTSVGSVDVYAIDSYPQGSCATPQLWSDFPIDYWNYHLQTNPQDPLLMPEFQGGSFLGWGPGSPQYTDCNVLTGSDFEQVYYLNEFATGVKFFNIYMTFGGTSWGFFPFPGVYTSYDYGAAIAEDRTLTAKWREIKNIGTFIRSVEHDLARVSIIGNSSAPYTDNENVFVTELRNLDSGSGSENSKAAFYVVRQNRTSSFDTRNAKIRITTSAGNLTVPQTADVSITLAGRQSRVVLVDHTFGIGNNASVLYSTASLFYSGTIGGRDVLVLHGPAGQTFEVVLNLSEFNSSTEFTGDKMGINTNASFEVPEGYTALTFTPGPGQSAVSVTNTSVLVLGDTSSMDTVFAPIIPADNGDGSTFWLTSTNDTVLVTGPTLLRNASIPSASTTVELWGDTNGTTSITVYSPESVTGISWNGKSLPDSDVKIVAPGVLSFTAGGDLPKITVPDLGVAEWKVADGLPEIQEGYDDSRWVDGNKTESSNPFTKYYGDNYLYACEYGFCEGPVIWRGHFNSSTGSESAVNLSITGGRGFAGSVWLNDVFLGATYGNSSNNNAAAIVETTNETYAFPEGALVGNAENVIIVVHDNMGMEEAQANQFSEWLKTPRGIQGYYLLNATSQPTWKVQGKLGGFSEFPDRTRGIMNEGGFFGDRAGWHLPGFDDSAWNTTTELGMEGAGVKYFRTEFELDVPAGYDVKMSFNFPPYGSGSYRVFLYVNGWNMGRYVANLGPQSRFPVPEGILDYQGTNTVVLAVWATSDDGASIESFELKVDDVLEGGTGPVRTNNPGWEERDSF